MKTSDSPTLPLPPASVSRRRFLTTAATGAAGLVILPSGVLSGQDAPSNKLNVALIGTWGRGEAHFDALAKENVVALCDVDETHLAFAAQAVPQGAARTSTGASASTRRASTRWSAARPITPTRSSPSGP